MNGSALADGGYVLDRVASSMSFMGNRAPAAIINCDTSRNHTERNL
jgi:hypothetical protein